MTACVFFDPSDPVASQPAVRWAVRELRDALAARDVSVTLGEGSASESVRVLAAGSASAAARAVLAGARAAIPDAPEALGLVPGSLGGRKVTLACGSDARGLVYALLELADRVTHEEDPLRALVPTRPVVERPANAIRSVARFFTSEAWDKPWFHDRSFWRRYLTMLAAQRFNRFSLTLGLGYNAPRRVHDAYFFFSYPFLVVVPGYPVRVTGLSDAEREENLETLRFISDEATLRGLHFQLGLWTHAYVCLDSPEVSHVVEGLTPETHAPYCRDALRALLQACPGIAGITFRAHGESGIPERSYGFWETVFEGIAQCGRRVEIDLHTKGLDARTIQLALATGMPVNVSTKCWAEHMGLPYQQASIRPFEMPVELPPDDPIVLAGTPEDEYRRRILGDVRPGEQMALSSTLRGMRRFLRYGYGDLLTEDRRYGVFSRIWPGTQRVLLWGDPAMAAAYGRAAAFCGSLGLEVCEPLSFRGRMGSALPGDRDPYADATLKPAGGDWEKYLYTYRLWGRLLYNPDADPETWRRFLRSDLGSAAAPAEAALAHASRILPLVTTAHHPSASNNEYWPEIYTNVPIVDETRPHPYRDVPGSKRFEANTSLDPALFASIADFADEVLRGEASGRVSPLDVVQWLDALADAASRALAAAEACAGAAANPALRRLALDVEIQIGLGRFYARKLGAGVSHALFRRTRNRALLEEALSAYREARAAWAGLAKRARDAYAGDLTFGRAPALRGHWADRLADMDIDILDMERERADALPSSDARHVPALPGAPPRVECRHAPPASFRRGEPVALALEIVAVDGPAGAIEAEVRYRPVNQGEAYRVLKMVGEGRRLRATLPAAETDTPHPLQYFVVLRAAPEHAWLYPGFNAERSNQPYFVIRQG
ncbi:MAG: hypothetical protein HY321_12660 [Armatimonadetes bacterium]|nr:hypothetical protein [Armatimonadota bacterium]